MVILASARNVPKLYAPEMTKKRVFVTDVLKKFPEISIFFCHENQKFRVPRPVDVLLLQ